jgi:hypothetical protein
MKKSSSKKPIARNILFAIAVIVFGFILLNLVFIFYALFLRAMESIMSFIFNISVVDYFWFPKSIHALFLIIIGVLYWLVFKLKINDVYKAICMTAPLAVVFTFISILFYSWQILVYLFGALFSIGVLYYFYRTKQPWIYYYVLILIALVFLIVNILGIDI